MNRNCCDRAHLRGLPDTVAETVATMPPSRVVSKAIRPTVSREWGVNTELHTHSVGCLQLQAHLL
ncbi:MULTISPECIES: hypothetical protein [unclassified Nostoc]|uniref:hypothetical protein n=1 Tax=unclassified Nostoc TaxID=2593658 RepID=UPI001D909411|nr:hypothetical protein [Nostoc sp. JL34]MBN3885621.1 hypothetical protein [Nostoc sp. JL34]